MEQVVMMRVLASCVHLARQASCIVRDVYASKDLEIVEKGVNDFQSKADRDAQRCIIDSLNESFPGLKIIGVLYVFGVSCFLVGEEGQLEPSGLPASKDLDAEVMKLTCPDAYKSTTLSDMVVWVDPLDATKEYTEGLVEHVTILIGIAVNHVPVAGVMAQPFFMPDPSATGPPEKTTISRVIWALDGLGVFGMQPKRPSDPLPYIGHSSTTEDKTANVVTITRSHPTPNLSAALAACDPTSVIKAGGCGYKIILLLEGKAHVYLHPSVGTKRWDTCAPEAILHATGGRLTNMRGESYDYGIIPDPANRDGILATAFSDWHPIYSKLMPSEAINFPGSTARH